MAMHTKHVVLFTLLCTLPVVGQPTLHEADLMAAIDAHPDLETRRQALELNGRTQTELAGSFSNPYFVLERESVTEAGEEIETSLVGVRWTWDRIGSRKQDRRRTALEAETALLDFEDVVLRVRLQARSDFYRLFFLQERERETMRYLEKTALWRTDLQKMVELGERPALEVARLDLQLNRFRSRLSENRDEQAELWGRLAYWMSSKNTEMPRLQADYLPQPEPVAVKSHPRLQALAQESRIAELTLQSNSRRWTELELEAGWKKVDVNGIGDSGWQIGVAVPLPFRHPGAAARSRARLARSEAETALHRQRVALEVEVRSATQIRDRNLEAAREVETWMQQAADLESASLMAFKHGELDLEGYLQVLEQQLDFRLAFLEKAEAAWSASLALDYWEADHD